MARKSAKLAGWMMRTSRPVSESRRNLMAVLWVNGSSPCTKEARKLLARGSRGIFGYILCVVSHSAHLGKV
ncbi:hypothetical protein PG995_001263 [Apiospora arundinis]|uniref:Uncharacterized protein n=1 Tax=Apiospora arundinis TaxID=335852 RepID=A0ABR2J8I4_9PEZI